MTPASFGQTRQFLRTGSFLRRQAQTAKDERPNATKANNENFQSEAHCLHID